MTYPRPQAGPDVAALQDRKFLAARMRSSFDNQGVCTMSIMKEGPQVNGHVESGNGTVRIELRIQEWTIVSGVGSMRERTFASGRHK